MDEKTARAALEQAFRLWFEPELKRRKTVGAIPPAFKLWAVQVVLDLDADDPEVRFNEEIRGAFIGSTRGPAKVGKAVLLRDITSIRSMHLTEEDPDAGHLTAIVHNGHWSLFFDFRYNATRIADQLTGADQFLAVAASAIEAGHHIAAVDNLYDAVQIMAKCFLLLQPDAKAIAATTHGFIQTRFNFQGKMGNVGATSVRLLNRLADLRPKTRYAPKPANVSQQELSKLLEDARQMRNDLEERRPKRIKLPQRSIEVSEK